MKNKLHGDCHGNSIYQAVIHFIKTTILYEMKSWFLSFVLGCTRGFYGYNCNSTCGAHCMEKNNTCDRRTGDCPSVFFVNCQYTTVLVLKVLKSSCSSTFIMSKRKWKQIGYYKYSIYNKQYLIYDNNFRWIESIYQWFLEILNLYTINKISSNKNFLNHMYYYSLKCVLIFCFCTWKTTKGYILYHFFTTQVASNRDDHPGDNTGLAAGAGIGGAVLVILVIIGVIVFIRYRLNNSVDVWLFFPISYIHNLNVNPNFNIVKTHHASQSFVRKIKICWVFYVLFFRSQQFWNTFTVGMQVLRARKFLIVFISIDALTRGLGFKGTHEMQGEQSSFLCKTARNG